MDKKKWWSNAFLQQCTTFIAMFILTMLHEWMLISGILFFFKTLAFFTLLYIQAQINSRLFFSLFLRKKKSLFFSLTILTTFIGSFLLFLVSYYWIDPNYYQKENIYLALLYHFVICIVSTFTIMSLSLMQKYALEIQKSNQVQLRLNKMNIKFLSAQLNPHFFFNMLNNLYGVSLTTPARTPNLILKLSDLMRYQIENANKSKVKLTNEIIFIQNYIDLERERVGKRCKITFKHPHDLESLQQFSIAPLLLIILIENAFKHSITEKNWFVDISLECNNSKLILKIENSLPNKKLVKESTGIGLKNISQRLNFLYDGEYDITYSQTETMYQTTLILQLK